ncbi:MAG: Rieske 2Fe-2S domain-containing protein [Alphaproteobacteria bacterium]
MDHPAAPAAGSDLCALDDIVEPGAREFRFGEGPEQLRLFVVRHEGLVRAYRNLCPHFLLPLNIRPDQFLAPNGRALMCRKHYAQFDVATGASIQGPCAGQSLEPIPLALVDGRVLIAAATTDGE